MIKIDTICKFMIIIKKIYDNNNIFTRRKTHAEHTISQLIIQIKVLANNSLNI